MPLSEIFAPQRRQPVFFLLMFVLGSLLMFGFLKYVMLPETQKITIYSTVKPLKAESSSDHFSTLDTAETSMKIAEAITGWAQNPVFRQQIQDKAGLKIKNFKRKLSARKQNRLNVFWTLNLNPPYIQHQDKIIEAFTEVFSENWSEFNKNNAAPFALTPLQIYSEKREIPILYIILASLIAGKILAFASIYLKDLLNNKVSFSTQIKSVFPSSPMLMVPEEVGAHDEALLERFISTFQSPRLVGTFPKAEKHFSVAPSDALHEAIDTPILLVRLGDTSLRELTNLKAIFGDKLGLVVFEK